MQYDASKSKTQRQVTTHGGCKRLHNELTAIASKIMIIIFHFLLYIVEVRIAELKTSRVFS